jgi:tetratricopeptide (TPR) repeat protein
MKRIALALVVALILLAGLALGLWRRHTARTSGWTTSSPEALAAFEEGLAAHMKFYEADARKAFEQALKLDPAFVAAKLQLLDTTTDKAQREALLKELRAADREPLTLRERLLVEVILARVDGDRQRCEKLIAEYLPRLAKDPWAQLLAANQGWDGEDWKRAEEHYRKLLAIDPNWILARNNLGYLAMAQGHFAEAEEQFRAYRFVAPDQANPHDSLGELLTLTGRYTEAKAEFEAAVAIRADFCASYGNLLRIAFLEERTTDLVPAAERMRGPCDPELANRTRCTALTLLALATRDFEAPWREPLLACTQGAEGTNPFSHRMALLTGRLAEAQAMEEKLAGILAKAKGAGGRKMSAGRVVLFHLQGMRELAAGRWAEAIAKLRESDGTSGYWGADLGVFKLFNRMNLALALELAGEAAAARAMVDEVRAVNPSLAEMGPWLLERTARPGFVPTASAPSSSAGAASASPRPRP